MLACFGLDILANFQEARVVAAHMVGAMTCFSAGTLYFCLQVHRNTNRYVLSRFNVRDNVNLLTILQSVSGTKPIEYLILKRCQSSFLLSS